MGAFTMTWCAAPADGETDWLPEFERYVDGLDDAALLSMGIAADPFLDPDEAADLAEFDRESFRQSLLEAGRELLRRVQREGNREVLWLPDGIEGGLAVFVAGGMSAGEFSAGDGFDWVNLVDAANKHRPLPWA